jgi:hypothetical protein
VNHRLSDADHLMEPTMPDRYVVIQVSTGDHVLVGATLAEAHRFCIQFRGHYLTRMWF